MLKWMHNKQCMKSQTLQSQLDCQLKRPISEKQKVEMECNAVLYKCIGSKDLRPLIHGHAFEIFLCLRVALIHAFTKCSQHVNSQVHVFDLKHVRIPFLCPLHECSQHRNVDISSKLDLEMIWILSKKVQKFPSKKGNLFCLFFGQSPSVKLTKI